MLDCLAFQIPDTQHQEWFITRLLPHIRIPLTQQKITTQLEGIEIVMQLESTLVGVDNLVGMTQVQS